MPTTLYGAHVLTPTVAIGDGAVVVSDEGRIEFVGPEDALPQVSGDRKNLRGRIVVPGFVDIHQHGGNGVTFYVTPEKLVDLAGDLDRYSYWAASNGVTGFLCSIAAPSANELLGLVTAFADALDDGVHGAEALGMHLEGPFLSVDKSGAFSPDWLRAPSLAELDALLEAGQGWIRQMTMAPELPGAEVLAARLRRAGVVVALGHTNADYATTSAALRGNWTHVTHTFNAQRGFHHREPGALGAVLASEGTTAELIADGIHVHPGAMEVLVRCLGTQRIVLITDAMAGAGLPDGEYVLGGRRRVVKDGKSVLSDGTIAGSTATMRMCVRNAAQKVGLPLIEAVKLASLNPSRVLGLTGRLGHLAEGKDASLTVIDEDLNVYWTMVQGRTVYQDL